MAKATFCTCQCVKTHKNKPFHIALRSETPFDMGSPDVTACDDKGYKYVGSIVHTRQDPKDKLYYAKLRLLRWNSDPPKPNPSERTDPGSGTMTVTLGGGNPPPDPAPVEFTDDPEP